MKFVKFLSIIGIMQLPSAEGFNSISPKYNSICSSSQPPGINIIASSHNSRKVSSLQASSLKDDAGDLRMRAVHSTLETAEAWRKFRISTGLIPEIDADTGKRIKPDSKFIVGLSAAVVAIGIFTIRIGGRVALISAIGLDFANDNPQYRESLNQVLDATMSLSPQLKLLAFFGAWILTKVLVFDFGAIILALSSGVIFDGVLTGALLSALGSTIGSSAAYFLAKADTPARTSALRFLEEYPSLRGIEQVVKDDGLKAILTLRLAPILPIPIGAYNYIYGVTRVPYLDFAAGIFLGSFKPYLLDSYLGYFSKEIIGGTIDQTGYQDLVLITSLVASALIGIFASQLAGQSWDSITAEVQADKRRNRRMQAEGGYKVMTKFFGFKLPDSLIADQVETKRAGNSIEELIEAQYMATTESTFPSPIVGKATSYEYRVLLPALLNAFFTYSDPVVYDQGTKRQDNNDLEPPEVGSIYDPELAKAVIQELWYLPFLSILSGLSPAGRIIAESHVSRMPDTPIAHDIDTFLLWPAIGNPADRNLPPTILQTPAAAITDESQYAVDWDAVSTAFLTNVETSLLCSAMLGLALYIYLITGKISRSTCLKEVE